MAESTLNMPMSDLTGEVGAYLGWGRDSDGWTSSKATEIKACTGTMLRKFYFQAVDRNGTSHNWTFLKPVATIELPLGHTTAPLPDDFGGFEGRVTVSQVGLSGGFWPLPLIAEEQIRVKYAAQPAITGRPIAAAEQQVKGTTPTRSNRSQLLVYPIPDNAYVLQVPYYILPDYLTVLNPWAYGGAAHAETMKAGARSAAELYLDNAPGSETANYMQCLQASIQYDRRHQPKSLGINRDSSDYLMGGRLTNWPNGLWHPLGIGFLNEASYE